jgi:hypothetical protein
MHDLEALEHRGWQALSGPDGAAFYADVMADDGVMVFPFGMVLDKSSTLQAIAGERPWSEFELTDLRVIELTSDAALVTYRAHARRDGEEPYRALMTTAYAHRDGRWVLVVHQQTPF